MKVKNFEIENYRSLADLKIKDFGTTTVFYGLNNAGKSNVLNALHVIFKKKPKLSIETQTLSDLENFYSGVLPDFGNNYHNNTSNSIKFKVVLEVRSAELDIDSNVSKLFSKSTTHDFEFLGTISKQEPFEHNYSEMKINQVSVGSKVVYKQNESGFFYFPTLDKSRKNQSQLNQSFTRIMDVFNDCVHVIPSERDMLETNSTDERYQIELLNAKEYVINGDKEKAILLLDSLTKKPESSAGPYQLNSKSFKKFLYNLYLSPQKHHLFEVIDKTFASEPFTFGNISFSKEKDILDIMVNEGSFRLPIKHLGSGVMQSLFIITSIVCSKSKIICIEELEQNLSPNLQYQILSKIQQLIKNGQFDQLILSSHTSVYSKPKLGVIYFLEKVHGKTKISEKEKETVSDKVKGHFVHANFEPGTYKSKAEYEDFKKIIMPNRSFY